MRITILTQYYPPETGAPQNRLQSLALNLKAKGHEIEILTAMPNYPKMQVYEGYRGKFLKKEMMDGILVRRSWIYVSESKSIMPRLCNYFSFVFTSLITGLRSKSPDYLLCESPPLFLGLSAYVISRLKGAKLIFNVSDLWPESADKLDVVKNKTMLNMAYRLESWLYRKSFLVTGQTQGIVKDISTRFPKIPVFWLPNGIDEEVYAFDKVDESWLDEYGIRGKKLFMYAGILGHAQALEVIIYARELLKGREDVAVVIIGDGPLKGQLQELNKETGAGVIFIPNTPKDKVMQMVHAAYGYIVPLRRLDLFKGAIPSKIFDPLALGIPVLLGVEGEAKELFIDSGKAGLAFEPENARELADAMVELLDHPEQRNEYGRSGKEYVRQYFNRKNIAQAFLDRLSAQKQ